MNRCPRWIRNVLVLLVVAGIAALGWWQPWQRTVVTPPSPNDAVVGSPASRDTPAATTQADSLTDRPRQWKVLKELGLGGDVVAPDLIFSYALSRQHANARIYDLSCGLTRWLRPIVSQNAEENGEELRPHIGDPVMPNLVMNGNYACIGEGNQFITIYSITDGRIVRTFPHAQWAFALDDHTIVYAGQELSSGRTSGILYRTDIRTGRQQWQYRERSGPAGSVGPEISFTSVFAIQIFGDLVFVNTAYGHTLVDYATGMRRQLGSAAVWRQLSNLTMANDVLYAYNLADSGCLTGIERNSGTVLVKLPGDPIFIPTPYYGAGLLIFSGANSIQALDPALRTVRWSIPWQVQRGGTTTVAANGKTVFVSPGEELIAIDAASGRERWRITKAELHALHISGDIRALSWTDHGLIVQTDLLVQLR